ncbi:MAG: hypothetical protein IJB98_01510, partial [Clostridia bacterium]|nr:hypothetical protein [Clostridia bacterium]
KLTVNYNVSLEDYNLLISGNAAVITVEVNDSNYGAVDKTSIIVSKGETFSASQNVLSIGGKTITAIPTSTNATYQYVLLCWENATGAVTESRTITANFISIEASLTVYEMTFASTIENMMVFSHDIVHLPVGSYTTMSVEDTGNEQKFIINFEKDGEVLLTSISTLTETAIQGGCVVTQITGLPSEESYEDGELLFHIEQAAGEITVINKDKTTGVFDGIQEQHVLIRKALYVAILKENEKVA